MDECFEIITWKQRELHDCPIIFLNVDGFWDRLVALVDHQTESGFVGEANRRRMFTVASGVEEAVAAILAIGEQDFPAGSVDIR